MKTALSLILFLMLVNSQAYPNKEILFEVPNSYSFNGENPYKIGFLARYYAPKRRFLFNYFVPGVEVNTNFNSTQIIYYPLMLGLVDFLVVTNLNHNNFYIGAEFDTFRILSSSLLSKITTTRGELRRLIEPYFRFYKSNRRFDDRFEIGLRLGFIKPLKR